MKKLFSVLLLFTICVFTVSAAIYSYPYSKVTVQVGKNAVHRVDEEFDVQYYQRAHGIYRFIPYSYDNIVAKISDVSCNEDAEVSIENGFYIIRLGSEDKMVEGKKHYALSYDYDTGADFVDGYDAFYFNLLGTENDCRTDRFDFVVELPAEGLKPDDFKVFITKGTSGSEQKQNFEVSHIDNSYIISGTAYNLEAGEGVTIKISLPEGWYQGARQFVDFRKPAAIASLIISVLLAVLAYVVWNLYGRDDSPIITARYESPEGFSPLFVGYLADGAVNNKDITSMLFYWADKGYIKIEEPSKKHYVFTKLKDLPRGTQPIETDLFNGFFTGCDANGKIAIEKLRYNCFFEVIQRVTGLVPMYFTGDKALKEKKSTVLSKVFTILSAVPIMSYIVSLLCTANTFEMIFPFLGASFVVVFIVYLLFLSFVNKINLRKSNIFAFVIRLIALVFLCAFVGVVFSLFDGFSLWKYLVSFVCGCLVSFFSVIITKKSDYGKKLEDEVLGYREFIDKVSMDEIKLMYDKDPMVYYHVLSYAIVLGLADKWAKKFASVAVPPPMWYSGVTPFDVYFYSRFASLINSSIITNSIPVQNVKSISPGGFNFGGFSGGGFGGGGSRAW